MRDSAQQSVTWLPRSSAAAALHLHPSMMKQAALLSIKALSGLHVALPSDTLKFLLPSPRFFEVRGTQVQLKKVG